MVKGGIFKETRSNEGSQKEEGEWEGQEGPLSLEQFWADLIMAPFSENLSRVSLWPEKAVTGETGALAGLERQCDDLPRIQGLSCQIFWVPHV